MGQLDGKKILMVIASRGFRDEEYAQPRKLFDQEGAKVTVASSSLEKATGMLGAEVQPDILLKDANAADYDAVVFVGGNGAREYWNNPLAISLAKSANDAGKVLAAICIAPVILANANLVLAKKVTVFESEKMKLRSKGATITGKPVERDGLLITGKGPEAASQFARAILEALVGK